MCENNTESDILCNFRCTSISILGWINMLLLVADLPITGYCGSAHISEQSWRMNYNIPEVCVDNVFTVTALSSINRLKRVGQGLWQRMLPCPIKHRLHTDNKYCIYRNSDLIFFFLFFLLHQSVEIYYKESLSAVTFLEEQRCGGDASKLLAPKSSEWPLFYS